MNKFQQFHGEISHVVGKGRGGGSRVGFLKDFPVKPILI